MNNCLSQSMSLVIFFKCIIAELILGGGKNESGFNFIFISTLKNA